MEIDQESALITALQTTYHANLAFLSEYDKSLYERVFELSEKINSNRYQEEYFLEFIPEDLEFDIYTKSSDTYLYNRTPKKWNRDALMKTNMDMRNSIHTLPSSMYKNNSIVDLTKVDLSNPITKNSNITASDISNFVKYLNQQISSKNIFIKECNKFIFMGTLLGRHIPQIIEKLKANVFLICENNLEIFRLSLFVCDYSLLARDGKSVIFSIMDDDFTFTNKAKLFVQHNIFFDSFYKYYSTNYNVNRYFELFISAMIDLDPFGWTHSQIIDSSLRSTIEKFKKYNILNFQNLKNIFEDKPILYLGAGPSLDMDFKWVKENKDRFIIVAMGSVFNKLALNDIQPDIITTVDPQIEGVLKQFDKKHESYYKKAILMGSVNTPIEVLDIFDQDKIFLFENSSSFIQGNQIPSGSSVGDVTYMLLLLLKAKEIYMLGLDMAVDHKTGQTHSSNNYSNDAYKVDLDNDENLLSGHISFRKDILKVKGNFHDEVYTLRFFHLLIASYNNITQDNKQDDTNIYNLSQNGAYINDTIPLHSKDIKIDTLNTINKDILQEKLLKSFQDISVIDIDTTSINIELEGIQKTIKAVADIKDKHLVTFKDFENEIKSLTEQITDNLDSSSYRFYNLYLTYQNIIYRYISFSFNNRLLYNEEEKINYVKYIWCENITYLFNKYIKNLKKIL